MRLAFLLFVFYGVARFNCTFYETVKVITGPEVEKAVLNLKAKLQRQRDLKRVVLHRVMTEVSHGDLL